MIFRQYLHDSPVISISYLAGCGGKGKAIVIDPVIEHVDQYVKDAKDASMDIVYVIDTHIHADHISGARKLIELTNAEYVLHKNVQAGYPFLGVLDGDKLEAGNTVAQILYTPGHTPEHISVVITDQSRSREPWFVLTGHTLMVGDVGRTELASGAEEGARLLYNSLHHKLLTLPDYLEIYPGAYSGSVCGRSLSGKPSSSIGYEKHFNKALQINNEKQFVEFMLSDIPQPPLGFEKIRAYNMGHSEQ